MHTMMNRKLFRDMKTNAAQFISIFIIITLGMSIYTGLNSISIGMRESAIDFYSNNNLSDATIYGNFTEKDLTIIKSQPGIIDAELRFQFNVSTEYPSEDGNSNATLQLNYIDKNNISSMELIDGEHYVNGASGLWLDSTFANFHNLHVGDQITYTYEGFSETKEIKGLVMHPEYVFAIKDESEALPNHNTYGFCFMSAEEFTLLPALPYNQILLETDLNKTELTLVLEKCKLDTKYIIIMQNDYLSVNQFANEVEQMKSIQTIFPLIFLLVAILTILTTMTRITVKQRMQIGILKALGFSNRKILFHYSAFGFFLSLIGSILGSIIGLLALPEIIYSFQRTMYILPEWKKETEPYVFVVVSFCVLCCAFCGFWACKKQLEGSSANILRPKVGKTSKITSLEKSMWWKKRSFDVQWNLRDCKRNILRTFITIFGIAGSMTLVLCALGMKDTMDELIHTSYYELNDYETKVTLSESLPPEVRKTLEEDDKKQFLAEGVVEVHNNDEIELINLTVISPGNYLKYKDKDNKQVELPSDGFLLSEAISEKLNLFAGDDIIVYPYGSDEAINGKVSCIIKTPVGQGLFASTSYYESLNQIFQPTSFVTDEINISLQQDFLTIQTKEDLIHTIDELLSIMNILIAIMIAAAATLSIVVLYNLGVLSFFEKERELATLKVLGFQYKRLTTLLQKQNIWLTTIGVILGIPSGFIILNSMLQFMGENYDLTLVITPVSYILSSIGVFLLSTGVNRLMSRKLKRVDMVSALKSTE